MKIISSKFFIIFSLVFGISFLGYLWFDASTSSQAQVVPQFVNYNHNGEQMVLTRILAADRTADTGTKACAKVRGSNGQPMVCKNNVESFPYLGNKGCQQFYPNAIDHVSTYPGHGAQGGHYDLMCLSGSSVGDGGTCSGLPVNTCTTCPQCAKNLDCDEALSAPSDFADGAIVRCFDGADSVDSNLNAADLSSELVLKMTFDEQNALDFSGQNNHGTEQGGIGYSSTGCQNGTCAQFAAGSRIFSDKTFELAGDMTITGWVKAGRQRAGARILESQQNGGVGLSMYFDAGRIVLDNGGGPNSVLPSSSGFEDNQWHHVAAVRSGTNYTLYVDGNLIGNRLGNKPVYTGYSLARWSNGANYMQGSLDEVYIFNRGLTQSEIRQVKDRGVSTSGVSTTELPPRSLPPVVASIEVQDVFLTEVKGADTGNTACAKFSKVCVGPSTFNRSACLSFYPHAKTLNTTVGPQTEHFCKADSTVGVCAGTSDDTCVMAVSSSQQVSCEDTATNIDSFFVECEDPFSPVIIEQMGGALPPLSPPEPRNDGSGYVDYTVTIHHPEQLPTLVGVEYSTDGGSTYSPATLVSALPSDGTVSLANGLDFQIGTTDSVDTDAFDSVVLDFVWDSGADDVSADEALLKIIVQDLSGNTASDVSQVFEVEGGDHGSAPTDSLFKPRPPEVDVFEGTEQPPAGNRGSENFQNCLESEGNEETPCETSEEITEYLDALVNSLVTDADLSEKEKAKAEFIKRYLALQNNGQTLEEKLRLFDHGMTRGETVEMLVFLLTSHGVILQNGDLALKYSDVSAESPYAQAIAYATAYGIVEGYPDGSFRPEQSPNLAEVARMVVRSGALIRNSIQNVYSQEGLKAAGSDWFKPYIETLRHYGLTLPRDYEGLGVSVSGLRVLDILYDLLLAVGVNGFVNNS